VTTWVDPSSHRILKSHMTGTDDVSVSMAAAPGGPPASGPMPVSPLGAMSAKGSQSLNLDPA